MLFPVLAKLSAGTLILSPFPTVPESRVLQDKNIQIATSGSCNFKNPLLYLN
jgi:hypothetical protein